MKQCFWIPLIVVVFLAIGCETNDVTGPGPEVVLSLSESVISENGGTAEVVATLTKVAEVPVVIVLKLGGTAQGGGVDFSISSGTITIPVGSTEAVATVSAVDNAVEDGNRFITIEIEDVEGGQYNPQNLTLTIEDDDAPVGLNLIFNEVLYDPWNSGLLGDANGDGVYAQADDEFIEILNLSSQAADISGFKVYDELALSNSTPRHVFPAGTIIPPGKALVLFGGGSPTGTFGGAVVQTSTTGDLNMSNAGDVVRIFSDQDSLIIEFDINGLSANPNESYTRNPDITGDFEQHSTNTPLLFSPGTRVDGNPF